MCTKLSSKLEKSFISVEKHCFNNSSVISLISLIFYLTFDKQLTKIQKFKSGLPDPKLEFGRIQFRVLF